MMRQRKIYIVSDLHLGGDPADAQVPGDRGFRMCTQGSTFARFVRALIGRAREAGAPVELIVAGDFVDFLAEPDVEGCWTPFHRDPAVAVRILRRLADEREPEVFAALRELLAAGHRLTVLLGNHDLELSLPAVRMELERVLGAGPGSSAELALVYDNEAYVVGDAVVEHGHRADVMNEVDYDALRAVRVLQSRWADDERAAPFTPPIGSRLVASVMNPIKRQLPFVDLLKPETTGLVPVLLALAPGNIARLPRILGFLAQGSGKAVRKRLSPSFGAEIASALDDESAGILRPPPSDPVAEAVRAVLPPRDAAALLDLVSPTVSGPDAATGCEISAGVPEWRADAALLTLRALIRRDRTFDTSAEQGREYRRLATKGPDRIYLINSPVICRAV